MTNISTSTVRFQAGNREATGYQAVPPGGPHPGVIVIQEWWGLNDHIKDIARRAAAEGFVALAPDLYDGRVTTDPQVAQGMLQSLDRKAALQTLTGAVHALKNHAAVASGQIGAMGFCMGGFYTLLLASTDRDVRAAAPFYGHIPPDETLAGLTAPVLYVYAGKDQYIPSDEVGRLDDFLKRTGNAGAVLRYPDADHAFVNDTRKEVYKADDANDAWGRAIAFLKRHVTRAAAPQSGPA